MKSAFTLIELMIVVAVAALLTALAIPNIIAYRQNAIRTSCLGQQRQIRNAFDAYSTLTSRQVTEVPPRTELYSTDHAKWLQSEHVFFCPSGAGEYVLSLDPVTHEFRISCKWNEGSYAEQFPHVVEGLTLVAE